MLLYLLFFIVLIIFIYFFRNSIIINIYKLPMIRKSWQLPHMNAHNANLVNNDKPVVVCCGDSITHGHIGYDWVSTLRKNDDSKVYINAGINADLTWNLNQRIEGIIKHDPEYITILIGTNDAIGSQPVKLIQDYYMETKGLPQKPSIEWYKEQLEFFIKNIKEYTNAKIAIFTLPWLGEQKTSSIMQVVRSHNKIIKDLAKNYNLEILDLYNEFDLNITKNNSVPYPTSELRRLRGLRAVVLHYVFGWSWNDIGEKYRLKLLCDHIHLNERGGLIIKNLAKSFLSNSSYPG